MDYVGIDIPGLWSDLQRVIAQVADEMNLDVEAVPYQEMIPLPVGFAERHIPIGEFGSLKVYVFDPYSMALGKLDRGSESDLQDIVFMIHRKLIELIELEKIVQAAIPLAQEFDLTPRQMRQNLETVRQMMNEK